MIMRSLVIRAVRAAAVISAGDGAEQQRHGQRKAQVRAQEADVHGVRVLDDQDQYHDEDAGGGAAPLAEAGGKVVAACGAAGSVMALLPSRAGPVTRDPAARPDWPGIVPGGSRPTLH